MELKDVFENRRSARKFKEDPISDDIINDILDAANKAPCTDSCNYYFGVIKNQDIKNLIAESTIYTNWVKDAPVVFVCCSNISYEIQDDDSLGYIVQGMKARYGREIVDFMLTANNRKSIKALMQSTPVYIAAQHMILSAVSHGLRGCFVDFINLEKINKILKLPEHISCELIVPIGYPDEKATPIKVNEEDNVFFDTWKTNK